MSNADDPRPQVAKPPSPPSPPSPGLDPPGEEAELVLRSQRGDQRAFEHLVQRTARLLYSRHYLDTGDAHKAEDLVQETYLVAWRSIGQMTEPRGFRPWLMSVGRSVWLDAGRRDARKKRGRRRTMSDGSEAMQRIADDRPSPLEAAERDEQRRRALDLLRDLPEDYRLALTLRYIGGADYDAIGRQLGISNGSLRGFLNRGLARLREKLDGV